MLKLIFLSEAGSRHIQSKTQASINVRKSVTTHRKKSFGQKKLEKNFGKKNFGKKVPIF